MPSTVTDSLVSSSSRKVALRVRTDLVATRQIFHGREFWIVKDPLALNYYRLQAEEYAILPLVDGRLSLEEIQEQFEAAFPPQKISLQELHHHIGTFHRQGLLVSAAKAQGTELIKRDRKKRSAAIFSTLANLLAIRFKGIDPERLLNWLYPKVRWFFTPLAMAGCLMLGLSALLLVLTQFETFRARLPEFHEFFAASNWFYLAAALVATKIIHEFGHGLTCKHFGGECHEMGVLLLCLTPCLYCNVSDSWLLPNKWKRAAIGAGGMYVELVMASVATFLWWFSGPGVLHQLMLCVMFVCSVSTLLFNANPLLRYDGYYILSDVMEIPNLRQKSNTILQRTCGQICLGLEYEPDPFLPQRNRLLFVVYAVASFVYGWLVVLGILYFLNKVFEPYGLKIIGQVFALVALAGMVVQPLHKLWQFVIVPGRVEKVKRNRLLLTKVVVLLVLAGVAFWPLPHRVYCSIEVAPRGAEFVYVDVPGQVEQVFVRPGARVRKGDPIAQLKNVDLEIAIKELEGRRDEAVARRRGLQALRDKDKRIAEEVAALDDSLAAVEMELTEKRRSQEHLRLVAPVDGVVLESPPQKPAREAEGRLPGWIGTPLDPRNQDAWLEEGTMFCLVGDPHAMQANLFIDQGDVEYVLPGQALDVKIDQARWQTLHSQVEQVAQVDAKTTPQRLSHKVGGQLQTKTDAAGVERPESASYQANAWLSDPAALLRPGLRGEAKVYVGYQSLGSRCLRYLRHTFNFKM